MPLVSGVTADEPREVIRQAGRRRRCRLLELGGFAFEYRPPAACPEEADAAGTMDFRWRKRMPGTVVEGYRDRLGLAGRHQAANMAVAQPWASCSRSAGTSPGGDPPVVWPPWRGRGGWKWRPGDRPSRSTRP